MNYQNYDSRYSDHKIITNYSWPIQIDLHLHTTKSDGNLTPVSYTHLTLPTKA